MTSHDVRDLCEWQAGGVDAVGVTGGTRDRAVAGPPVRDGHGGGGAVV
ncbi:hypothetical protein ACFY9A_29410 [Streptomyces rubradiris]